MTIVKYWDGVAWVEGDDYGDGSQFILVDGTRAFTGDVTVGVDGVADMALTIRSSSIGDYLKTYTSGSNSYIDAVGGSLYLDADSNIYLRPTGGSTTYATFTSTLAAFATDVAIGVNGTGGDDLYIYGSVLGDYLHSYTSGSNGYLQVVGGGSLYMVTASGRLEISAAGNVSIGVAGGGTRQFTVHSGVVGDHAQIRSGGNYTILDAVGGSLYLDADVNGIYCRPNGGSTISAKFASADASFYTDVGIGDGTFDAKLAIHSGTGGVYGQVRTGASSVILDAVGGSLYLDADSNIYLRPTGGSTIYATFTSSLATFATDVSIGTDGTGGDDLYIYGSVLGDYLHAYTSGSNSFLDAVGGVLYLGADSTVHISGDLGCIIGSSTDVVQLKVQASIAQSAHLTSWVDGLAATKSWADSAGILKTATNPTTDDALVRRGYLGTSATKDTGAGSGDVATGDHTHTGLYAPLAAPALTGAATLDGDALATEVYVDGTVQTASSSPVTVVVSDKLITADATSGSITVNLPAAASAVRTVTVAKVDSGFNLVTIDPNASETIDGSTTLTLSSQWASSTLISDGSNWFTA